LRTTKGSLQHIDELHVKQNILQSDIDIVAKNLCDLFSKSSSYVFGTVNKKPRNRNSSNKPWYNANCKISTDTL
jgi:hypothetical protein